MKHVKFAIINAIRALLADAKYSKRELYNLLSSNFTRHDIDIAIQGALSIRVIKVAGLIKPRNHEQTKYMLI